MRTEDKVGKKQLNEVLLGRKGGPHRHRQREIEDALADDEIEDYLKYKYILDEQNPEST